MNYSNLPQTKEYVPNPRRSTGDGYIRPTIHDKQRFRLIATGSSIHLWVLPRVQDQLVYTDTSIPRPTLRPIERTKTKACSLECITNNITLS